MALLHIEGFDIYSNTYSNMPAGGAVRRLGADSGVDWAFTGTGTRFSYGKALEVLGLDTTTVFSTLSPLALNVGGFSGNLIIGFAYYYPGGNGPIVSLANALGYSVACLGVYDTGYLVAWGGAALGGTGTGKGTDAPQIAAAAERPLVSGSWHYIEMEVGSSKFAVWVDGNQVINSTASLATDDADAAWGTGVTDVMVGVGGASGEAGGGQIINSNVTRSPVGSKFDDLYVVSTSGGVRTTRRGDSRVEFFVLDTQVSNTGYAAVGGTNVEDRLNSQDGLTSGYSADADEDIFIGSSNDSLTQTPASIHGIEIAHVSRKTLSGEVSVATVLVSPSGGTQYDGTPEPLSSSDEQYRTVYEQNPNGSTDWLKATVEGVDFGFTIENG